MSDFFYDGQVKRYLTQFMRVFIGFKYQLGDGTLKYVPVAYGDLSRQVANAIAGNSENTMPSVPKISCYITGMEMDKDRLSDSTFISKLHIRERDFEVVNGVRQYTQTQGGNYTVERLMPTPYKLNLKADIWTSSADQKLQLLEQILVLFNPVLELQTNDNYVDWTAITTLELNSISFSSRTIPAGSESEIDIATLDFTTPIWISPPVKVKKMGIVKNIIMNIFTDNGAIKDLDSLVYNSNTASVQIRESISQFGVLVMRNTTNNTYECTVVSEPRMIQTLDINTEIELNAETFDWNAVIDIQGKYTASSKVFFLQPTGYEVAGTFAIHPTNPSILVINFDSDTIPSNTEQAITAIINPTTFNPKEKFNGILNIPIGTRYLVLENLGYSGNLDGADGWKDTTGNDTIIRENSIIEWNGIKWIEKFDPTNYTIKYVTNLTTGIQYKWEQGEWTKSFEGEYAAGYWRFNLDA